MTKKLFILMVFLLTFSNIYSVAESENGTENIKNILLQKYKGLQYISFKFIKKTSLKTTGDISVISGKAEFQKPALYKIITKKPVYQEIVSDGIKRYLYSKKNKQVIISKNIRTINIPDFNSIISYYLENYDLKEVKSLNSILELNLSKPSGKETCKMKFILPYYIISELELENELTKTNYKMLNVSEKTVPQSISNFSFHIPAGIEIVEEEN